MTTQELKQYIDKVLGNSIRCLLPSYWWKRLFNQVADRIDEVDEKTHNKVGVSDLKTINGESIVGEGDIHIDSNSVIAIYEDETSQRNADAYNKIKAYHEKGLPINAVVVKNGMSYAASVGFTDFLNTGTYVAIAEFVRTTDAVIKTVSVMLGLVQDTGEGVASKFAEVEAGDEPIEFLYLRLQNPDSTKEHNAKVFQKMNNSFVRVLFNDASASENGNEILCATYGCSYVKIEDYFIVQLAESFSSRVFKLTSDGTLTFEYRNTHADSELSETSTNAIQNKAVYAALQSLANDFQFSIDNLSESDRQISQEITTINEGIANKQDKLVSGTNIKTINGTSLLGGGDVTIVGEKGEKGDKGDTGPEGPKGDKGDKGDTGAAGANGTNGKDGADGEDGATFTPSVDANGNLSWTNNKGLSNPPMVNIKGPKGDSGEGGGSEEDIRYFTEFTVEQVAAAGALLPINNSELFAAAENNKLICIPCQDGLNGFIVASYEVTLDEDLYVSFIYGTVHYRMFVMPSNLEISIQPLSTPTVFVDSGFIDVYDNTNYVVTTPVTSVCIQPMSILNVGSTIRFTTGEDCSLSINMSSTIWANGVIPTIESGVTYELSIVFQSIAGSRKLLAVLTPFKSVE